MTAAVRRSSRGRSIRHRSPGAGPLLVLVGLVLIPVALAVTLQHSTYDVWGAFVWGPVLLALAFPFCKWVTYRTGERDLLAFFFGAAVLKIFVGAVTRYYVFDSYYERLGDAARYDDAAAVLTEPLRKGVFEGLGQITGTRFIEVLNGIVQAIIGQTEVGSWLVFSSMGFVGMCFLYIAFCEAVPEGNRRLYRCLLFLMPTMWFWPSSVGKEAFLTLCIGGVAFGYTRMLNGHMKGLVPLLLGFWGTAVVRPHVALMLAVGVVLSLPPALYATKAEDQRPRLMRRLVLPLLVLLLLPVLLARAEEFFDIEGLDVDSAEEFREEVTRRTAQGGSEFAAPDTGTPQGLVAGLVTVSIRPFPWEANGAQVLAAAEALLLVAIIVSQVARSRVSILNPLRDRWPRFALGYVLAFGWGFSAVANFGILARQRSLMLPFLFVLIAAPSPGPSPGRTRAPLDAPNRAMSDPRGTEGGLHGRVDRVDRLGTR